MDVVIEAHEMEKRCRARRVLRGLTFSLPRGSCLLVTRPNGSGKTTLLRLLAGLTAPTRHAHRRHPMRSRLGYLAHEPLLYRELTGLENLELFGRLYRIHERRERIGMLLERFGIWGARRARRRLLEGHGATAGTLPGAAPRAGAAGPRRAVHRARRTGVPSCSTASSRRSPVRRRSSIRRPLSNVAPGARAAMRRLPRRRRRAHAEPRAGSPCPRHAAGDALRARSADRLPLRASGRHERRRHAGSSGSRSSSRRSSASRAHGCRRLARHARRLRPRDTRPQRHLGRQDARRARVPRGHRGCRTACLHAVLRTAQRRDAGAALATVGICAVGSLASALASAGRGREVILPLLLLPLMIPVVIFAVGAAVSEEARDVPA